MTDARYRLLETMHDLMSNYLANRCPTNTTWEDFDRGIDSLRFCVTDILADDYPRETCATGLPVHIVEIRFFSGDDHYGTEIYSIASSAAESAELCARILSLDSVYSDTRIPDLHCTVSVKLADEDAHPS